MTTKSKILQRLENLGHSDEDPIDKEIRTIVTKHKALIEKFRKFSDGGSEVVFKSPILQVKCFVFFSVDNGKVESSVGGAECLFSNPGLRRAQFHEPFHDMFDEYSLEDLAELGFAKCPNFKKTKAQFDKVKAEIQALPKKEREVVLYELDRSC